MPWPAPYYWAAAKSASADLFASMAVGSYAGPMTADLGDIHRLVANRLVPRLRAAPGALARHLAPKAFAGMCPPPRDSETAQYTS